MATPNVLFIFADQQRYDTVSCYGKEPAKKFNLTPNLDRLAKEGTRFDNAMTCQPVCGPARACIQSGQYPTEIGCHLNDLQLPEDGKYLADYFNEAGYETAYVGKWHLASNKSFANPPCADSIDYKRKAVPEKLRGGYRDFWVAADVLEFTSHGYGGYMFDKNRKKREFLNYRVDATTDFALEYLRKPKEKPFFMFISYIEPHHQNDKGHSEGPQGSKEMFKNFIPPEDLKGKDGSWKEELPEYLGCCKSLDDNVGRIVQTLKKQGIYENTVIFYTADHGSHFKTRNEEYKRTCHDASIHVPFIAAGPGFAGGHVVEQLTSLIDITPTLLVAGGIEKPKYMPGIPMQYLVGHPEEILHEEVFIQISESGVARALRTPEYTYCVEIPLADEKLQYYKKSMWRKWDENNPLQETGSPLYREALLYDLKRDPYQKKNCICNPEYKEVKEKLRKCLTEYIQREERREGCILKI